MLISFGHFLVGYSHAVLGEFNLARAELEQSLALFDLGQRHAAGTFEIFYQRYERLIYHCIRTRSNEADVADLFQGFFERLVDREYHILKLWQRGTSLPIYLSKIIRNFVIDFHRKKRIRWRGRRRQAQCHGGLLRQPRNAPRRGVFRSVQELKDAIHRFLDETNANPKPFTWTKDPNKIIAAIKRAHQVLDSIH
jgi:RNA polymerase sigma factor (sigma-70 family)